jgi:hypothetical protein
VWALNYEFDATATGRTIKILHVVDEFTRESLADLVDHSIVADPTVACLDKISGSAAGTPSSSAATTGPNSPRTRCGPRSPWAGFTWHHAPPADSCIDVLTACSAPGDPDVLQAMLEFAVHDRGLGEPALVALVAGGTQSWVRFVVAR